MNKPLKVIIIGAGIGGLTTAVALQHIGCTVEIYEQAPELRTSGSGLSVMSNASVALGALGINLNLEHFGAPVETFEIRTASDRLLRRLPVTEVSAENGAASVCISRKALQQALLQQLPDIEVKVSARAVEINQSATGISVKFTDGREAQGDILIGADGIYSTVRTLMHGSEPIRTADYICWLAITRYQHQQITPGYIVHYWGAGKRIGLIDIGGGEIYWWGTANMKDKQARTWQGSNQDVAGFYQGWPNIVSDIILKTPSTDIIAVPAQDRHFSPHWGKGRITLLGDAAHPMLASLGQGAGMAMEDAAVLAHAIIQKADPIAALRFYEKTRIPRAEMMVNASRSMSDIEQEARFFPRLKRDLSMRLAPESTLKQNIKSSLIFTLDG
ncbi:FAD-dependent monooxygenase [Photorhabdus viridis]|uniref:FAD-dependent monooxygenase n=1 Tax=Photorhabdus viridis TaxID=3163327 RepID=UPI0033070A66